MQEDECNVSDEELSLAGKELLYLVVTCHNWPDIQVINYDRRSIVNDNRMQISGLQNNK